MADDRKDNDIWAQLLGAAQTEAAKQQDITTPKGEPEDPWAQLLSAAEKHIAGQEGETPPVSDMPFAKGSMLLDTYRIESDPMHGGMGDVWRVHHTGWNVDLAMKRPQKKMFASESSKQGFIDECRNWINLGLHPNIVSCYYVREIDGVPTIFSEWMENGDLEHHIRKGTLYDGNEKEVQKRLLDIAIQYARGLRYAHDAGLIHQDVKPANLLLTNDWQAKAADFGLANARAQLTVLEGDATRQDPGQSLNAAAGGYTPAYCSMEQMDRKQLTRRTDIYSWAVSVMEMYYGSRPWVNGPVAGMSCRDYFEDPECRVPVPEKLRDLLARCMALEADDRPHDFGIVEDELKKIWREAFGEDYPRPESEAAPDTADSLNNMALTYLDLGMPEKAEEYWKRALEKTPDHPASACNRALYRWRNGEIEYDELVRIGSSPRVAEAGMKDRFLAQAESEKKDIAPRTFYPFSRGESGKDTGPRVRFSPDGKILYTAYDAVFAYRTDTMDEVYRNREGISGASVDMLEVTPDGRYLLFHTAYPDPWIYDPDFGVNRVDPSGDYNRIWVADAASGKILYSLDRHTMPVTALCVFPDSVHCVTAGRDNRLVRWDLTTGRREQEMVEPLDTFLGLSASSDGKTLCGRNHLGTLWTWEAASFRHLKTADNQIVQRFYRTWDACFATDGESICAACDGGIAVCETDTLEARLLIPDRHCQRRIRTVGKAAVTGDEAGGVTVRDPETFRPLQAYRGFAGKIESLDISPDLSRIAAGDNAGNLLIWDRQASVRRVPWELNRISGYEAAVDRKQAEQGLRAGIESAIDNHRIDQAILLLNRAESEEEPYTFFDLRRRISRQCAPGCVTGWYTVWQRELDHYDRIAAFHPQDGTMAVLHSFRIDFHEDTGRLIGDIRTTKMDHYGRAYGPALCYSPDGQFLAVGSSEGTLLLDPKERSVRRILPGINDYVSVQAFSPDGRFLAATTQEKLCVWDLETGLPVLEEDIRKIPAKGVVFPYSTHLAVLESNTIHVFSVPQGREARIIRPGQRYDGMALGNGGKELFLFTEGADRNMVTLRTDTWQSAGTLEIGPRGPQDPAAFAVSPDSRLLAVSLENQIIIRSLRDGRVQQAFHMTEKVFNLAFSPDGNMLLIICEGKLHCLALQRELVFPG